MPDMAADYYERYWSPGGYLPERRPLGALTALLAEFIPDGASVLDVGCGDGAAVGTWCAAHNRRYVGTDVSHAAVALARQNGFEATVCHDAASLPFPDARFDAVSCLEVVEHLFDPLAALREAARVLRAGGVLLVTTPNIAYWRWRVDMMLLGRWNPLGDPLAAREPWRDPHIRFFTLRVLRRMLVAAGLEPIRLGAHHGSLARDVPWLGKRLRLGPGGPVYRMCERLIPSVLGYRLHAVARKGGL